MKTDDQPTRHRAELDALLQGAGNVPGTPRATQPSGASP